MTVVPLLANADVALKLIKPTQIATARSDLCANRVVIALPSSEYHSVFDRSITNRNWTDYL